MDMLKGYDLIETFLISLLIFGLGFLLDKKDPLFLRTEYQILNLLIVFISLYYGFLGSLAFIFMLLVEYSLFYKPFPHTQFLQNLLFALISSEFRYIWQKKIEVASFEKDYTEEMANAYRREFFKLKLEYDLLEELMVSKTYSLRRIIEKFNIPSADVFMELISDYFRIYSAELYKVEGKRLISIKKIGEGARLNLEDETIKEAIESNRSFYIPPKEIFDKATDQELNLIAIVVAETYIGKYLLAIKDMEFSNINDEVLIYITILLEYFGDSIAFESSNFIYKESCSRDFNFQVFRMYNLKKKFGIDSYIVKCEVLERRQELKELPAFVRGLDRVCVNQTEAYILLSITPKAGVEKFLERLKSKFSFLEVLEIKNVEDFSEL